MPYLLPKPRLHGVSVFLSASVPIPERSEEYERIPEAPLQIEEAVACVARAIFMEGGTLVFGAHPSISPLVAQVIDHYYVAAPAEEIISRPHGEDEHFRWMNPSLKMFQSEVWREWWAEASERLSRHPLVQLDWIQAVSGESVDPSVKNRPQAPGSMKQMRQEMIKRTDPAAMIAIGGMKGVLDEAEEFLRLRPGKPIFTFVTTGGAAAVLAKKPQFQDHVRVPDQEAEHLVRGFWSRQEGRELQSRLGDEGAQKVYLPYILIAQQVVSEIVKDTGGAPL